MGGDVDKEYAMQICSKDKTMNFSEIETVANGWIVDFLFSSLCYYFKEENQLDFVRSLQRLEALLEGSDQLKDDHKTKITICCFLARIVHGKSEDVHFESDEQVTPLMSALSTWESIRETVADEPLFEKVQKLLYIQGCVCLIPAFCYYSVAVYIENGSFVKAAAILKKLADKYEIPQNIKMKLSLILDKKDTYHQLLTSFNFQCLVTSVKTFLDSFLLDNPSDFLMKAAAKVVRCCQNDGAGETGGQEALGEHKANLHDTKESNGIDQNHRNPEASPLKMRPKKQLFSTQSVVLWNPQTAKKSSGIHVGNGIQQTNELANPWRSRKRAKKKWTFEEDRDLIKGVNRFGQGKWASILQNFEFTDRTGVMLKDRWRTLKRLGKVT